MRRFLAAIASAWLAFAAPALASQASLVTPGSPLPMTGLASFLDAALLSLGSCNSGNSAPANGTGAAAFAGECWIDTNYAANTWGIYLTPDGSNWVLQGTLNTSTKVWTPYSDGVALVTGTSGADLGLLNGNNTYSGNSIFTGTVLFSGAGVNNPTANGQAYFGGGASNGAIITGQGSGNDVQLLNKSGQQVCAVATGTQVLACNSLTLSTALSAAYLSLDSNFASVGGALALNSASGNKVLATPNGASGEPAPRALVGADLPAPGASSLGGVESYTSPSHQWINQISTAGVPSSAQPAFTDVSGTAGVGQGGSGVASPTAHAIQVAEGSSPFNGIGPCNANIPVTGQGSSSDPQCGGTIQPANGGSGIASPIAHALLQSEGSSAFGTLTAATAGNIPIDQGAGSDWLSKAIGGDCTLAASGALTCTRTSGTAFGPWATLASETANALYKGNGSSAPVASSLTDDGTNVYVAEPVDLKSHPLLTEIANASTTGTTANKLAKLSSGKAVILATTDTQGIIGVVVSGAGTSGNALIAISGQSPCAFDGTATAGDYVQASSSVAGDCSDIGTAYPGSGQALGRVITGGSGAGTYTLLVFPPEMRGGAGGGSGTVTSVDIINGTGLGQSGTCNSTSAINCTLNISNPVNATAPTVTTYTSSSGTDTTPAGVVWEKVRMCGGGGGGGGLNNNGGSGGNSTFGSSFLNANGGSGGPNLTTGGFLGGPGGGGSGGDLNIPGQPGQTTVGNAEANSQSLFESYGGNGGSSFFGSGGIAGTNGAGGGAAASGYCSGGGGRGGGGSGEGAAGGGAGGYVEKLITSPAGSYSYAIGSAGAASGDGGAAGTGGIITIERHYNY